MLGGGAWHALLTLTGSVVHAVVTGSGVHTTYEGSSSVGPEHEADADRDVEKELASAGDRLALLHSVLDESSLQTDSVRVVDDASELRISATWGFEQFPSPLNVDLDIVRIPLSEAGNCNFMPTLFSGLQACRADARRMQADKDAAIAEIADVDDALYLLENTRHDDQIAAYADALNLYKKKLTNGDT